MTVIAHSLGTAPASTGAAEAVRAPALALEAVPADRWDGLAAGFSDLCQEQLLTFAGIRWPGPAHEPVAFRRAGEVVGGALVMVQRLPLGLGQVAFTKWGPMLADGGADDGAQTYAGMIEALIAEYAVRRGMMLSVMAPAEPSETNTRYAHLLARGFGAGALLNYPLRYLVDVRLDVVAQRRSLDQHWRRQLNRAEKGGLAFERGGSDRLGEFTALYERMLARKRFSDYSAYETIPHLMALENEVLRPELFFVRKDGEVIAGAIVFKGGDRAVYLYGATLDHALPLRAGYFLHWNIIGWLRENTATRWYDLGGTDGFHGLHQFKKGMVGAAGAITPVPRTANYADRRLTYLVGSGALWAREAMHEVLRRFSLLQPGRARPTLPRHVESLGDRRL